MEKRIHKLVKPQLLIPLKPELGRGREFEIIETRTIQRYTSESLLLRVNL